MAFRLSLAKHFFLFLVAGVLLCMLSSCNFHFFPTGEPAIPDSIDRSHVSLSGKLQTVGTENSGQLQLPASWKEGHSTLHHSLVWTAPDHEGTVTMQISQNGTISTTQWARATADIFKQMDYDPILQENTYFCGYSCQKITATDLKYNDITSVTWIFTGEDHAVYLLSMDAPNAYAPSLEALLEKGAFRF